ncbi:hypothetical protein C474_14949 [Halogeometricum pallidum JCM 14848]|uniref:Uncharacterized protein n=1 Tax=Halogeometricum pallidum JCM 14848 TaxID=1227487 RepID=M0CYV4_HALPD|nr:hypothetical protein C474_14949 [Halogeometricum pallidum JCM 14848]
MSDDGRTPVHRGDGDLANPSSEVDWNWTNGERRRIDREEAEKIDGEERRKRGDSREESGPQASRERPTGRKTSETRGEIDRG